MSKQTSSRDESHRTPAAIKRKPLPTTNPAREEPCQGDTGAHQKTEKLPEALPQPERQTRRTFAAWSHIAEQYWIYESGSCVVSLLALTGLVLMLLDFDGRSRPQWPNYISVNTIVAIVTAILKAALMLPIAEGISELKWHWFTTPRSLGDLSIFDSASRGPWGSFLFLFHFKPHFLATVGATITILALAVDPFSQQIIKYRECYKPLHSAIAQIPRTNNYTKYGTRLDPSNNAIEPALGLSVYSGLLSPTQDASSLIPTRCPSGNCTFPSDDHASYSSLAVCQRSEDISQVSRKQKDDIYGAYKLPTGPSIAMDSPIWLSAAAVEGSDVYSSLFAFEALMFNFTNFSNPQPFAVRCSLYPCIKSWAGNISQGELTEIQVGEVPLTKGGGVRFPNDLGYVSDRVLRNGKWEACTSTTRPDDIHTVPNGTYGGRPPYFAPDCVWTFAYPSMTGVDDLLSSLFDQNTVNTTGPTGGAVGDPWMLNLFADGHSNLSHVNAYMNSLASSMTAHIRVSGDKPPLPYTNFARGVIIANETCVQVRWPWIALPASLVLCSIVFLIAMIMTTRAPVKRSHAPSQQRQRTQRSDIPTPLKSSPLPLVFHGMHPSLERATKYPNNLADMQRMAERLEVTLERPDADENWYFVQNGNMEKRGV